MKTNGIIWEDPNGNVHRMEGAGNINDDPHYKMANHLSDMITQTLTDDYNARMIIKNMIKNLITNQMEVFLSEYDNIVADDILRTFKGDLKDSWDGAGNKIENGIKFNTKHPDYSNARHAKLSSFASELREKIVMIKKSE